jgi:Flp pilus assembly protein TadD
LLSLSGILRDDAGHYTEAEKSHRAALTSAPKLAYLHNNLGYNLLLQGRAKEAADEFREALALEPHSRLANDNLGLALLAQWKTDEQPKEALLRWESVSGPATAHNNLASVLMEQGRYADARKELEIALSYQKDHVAAAANLRLLAELDGKSAAVPKDAGENARPTSFWKRVKNVLAGKNNSQGTPAEESAASKH